MPNAKAAYTEKFNQMKEQYNRCCWISSGIILLGFLCGIFCNYVVISAYLGFILACICYLAAIVYHAMITLKAFQSADKSSLDVHEKKTLRKYIFRLCCLIVGISVTHIATATPLITLPWEFNQRLIAVGWVEAAWLPGVIAIAVCLYGAWFANVTAIGKGYWDRESVTQKEKAIRSRYLLITVLLMLSVLFLQLILYCIPQDVLAGGNTYRSWEDFAAFMELPRDEWGNVVDRWLDRKTQLYAEDGTTVLCEYVEMNFSINHIAYSDSADKLPVTVYTNLQMKNAETFRTNANFFFCALYVVILIMMPMIYFWKRKR